MSHALQRYRLFIVGGIVVVIATAAMLWLARDYRFNVGGLAIDPKARINAEKTYELVVWEEEIIIPWAAKTQLEMLVDAIRQFQQLRPNAAITFSIVEPGSGREQLAAAVAAGVSPDVYGTAHGVVFHPQYQVPASPYMEPSEPDGPDSLLPVATGMLTASDNVWGWPRAVWWQTWLGRTTSDTALPPASGANWTWDELQHWARANNSALALNLTDIVVLEQLMSNAGASSYTDDAGNLVWTEALLTDVATLLRTWQREALVSDDASDAARTRLQSLLNGDAAVIGPVSPHLAQAIFRHSPDEYALLPVPHRADSVAVGTLDVSAYFVFRHAAYEGDDHTRLAAELAAFLAAYSEQWYVQSLGLIPVRAAGLATWHESAPLNENSRSLLQTYAMQAAPQTMDGALRANAWRAAVLPHWHSFWDGSMSPEQFADRVMAALRHAVTPE